MCATGIETLSTSTLHLSNRWKI